MVGLRITGISARVWEVQSSHDDDCTHDRSRPGHRGDPGGRSRRRPHRRRRGLRHRRRAPPAGGVPRPDLRHPGRPGQPGRNLVDSSVPRRALRQRPVHLRLPVQAVARPVDRGGRGDPRLPRRGPRGEGPGQLHRYQHRVTVASWSTADRRWTVEVTRDDTGQQLRFTAGFLWMCQGYYNHAKPYRPQWDGIDRFQGEVVHPQRWPEELDLAGKRVVVIGSGATAATLIPAIAGKAEHVTMLQRSPSYYFAPPTTDELAVQLRALDIPEEWTHEILRRQHISQYHWLARTSFETPDELHAFLIESIRPLLPEGFDVDKHFIPRYRPWQQRIAIVPDGDLFAALREGKASIVTDTIETFTEHGIKVSSGEEIPADIVVTRAGHETRKSPKSAR